MRPCLEPGCPTLTPRTRCPAHERARQQVRNADPSRLALYGGGWPAESRRIRAAQPWCSVEGCRSADLSVDHPTRTVLCRMHHSRLEAERRARDRVAWG